MSACCEARSTPTPYGVGPLRDKVMTRDLRAETSDAPMHWYWESKHEMAESDIPQGLSAPARRALANAGYERLEQLARVREADIKRLHGMGPTAVEQLRKALASRGLSFLS